MAKVLRDTLYTSWRAKESSLSDSISKGESVGELSIPFYITCPIHVAEEKNFEKNWFNILIPWIVEYLYPFNKVKGFAQVHGTSILGCSENIKIHIFYKPDSNYGALIYME